MRPDEKNAIHRIQTVLAAQRPRWLKRRYRHLSHPMAGYCARAAEALYEILGGSKKSYHLYAARDDQGGTHWWVQRGGVILDPTAGQYTDLGREPPYARGVRKSTSSLRNPRMLDRPGRETREVLEAVASL